MWIETTNTDSAGNAVTRRLKHPAVDEVVEFSANGKAQVTKAVGETLVEQLDSVRPVTDASGDADSAADDGEGDGTADE